MCIVYTPFVCVCICVSIHITAAAAAAVCINHSRYVRLFVPPNKYSNNLVHTIFHVACTPSFSTFLSCSLLLSLWSVCVCVFIVGLCITNDCDDSPHYFVQQQQQQKQQRSVFSTQKPLLSLQISSIQTISEKCIEKM